MKYILFDSYVMEKSKSEHLFNLFPLSKKIQHKSNVGKSPEASVDWSGNIK